MAMEIKWRVYLIALFSYSTIHAIRTMWSAIKSDLTGPPFDYEVSFLGALDMVVLFVLALFMNLLGPKIEAWGVKRTLIISMIALAILTGIIGFLLDFDFTSPWLYVTFFGLGVGFFSCVGWPCCLWMVSCYFDKRDGIALSAYNGTSQFGDFTSLITYFAVVKLSNWAPESSFYLLTIYLILQIALIASFIPGNLDQKAQGTQKDNNNPPMYELNEEKPPEELQNELRDNFQQPKTLIVKESNEQPAQKVIPIDEGSSQKKQVLNQVNQDEELKVTMFTVWLLPGVALNVLAYGFIKAINSFIVGWLVYYLRQIDLGQKSVLLTILWSGSVFIGGIVSAYFNKKYSKLIFMAQLFLSMICFIFIAEFHNKIYQAQIIIGLVLCAFFYGGPYNLMSTAIPIILGSQQQVQVYSNGKGTIIALMEGYGQFFCGISLLIVPLIAVESINIIGAVYCAIGLILLGGQLFRQRRMNGMKNGSGGDVNISICDS